MASFRLRGMPGWRILLAAVRRLATLSVSARGSGAPFFFGCEVAEVGDHTTQPVWIAPCCPRAVLPQDPGHPWVLMTPHLLTRVSPLPHVMVTGRGDNGRHRLGRSKGQATLATWMPRPSQGPMRCSTPSLPWVRTGEPCGPVYMLQAASTSAGPPILSGRIRPRAGRSMSRSVEQGHASGDAHASTSHRLAFWHAMRTKTAGRSPMAPPGFRRDTR
jgi:hypothetical protein